MDDSSSNELVEVDVSTLELASVDGWRVNDEMVAVPADNVLNSLFVECSNIGVCDESAEIDSLLILVEGFVDNIDEYIEFLTVVIG